MNARSLYKPVAASNSDPPANAPSVIALKRGGATTSLTRSAIVAIAPMASWLSSLLIAVRTADASERIPVGANRQFHPTSETSSERRSR
jgi:hypothetical protein